MLEKIFDYYKNQLTFRMLIYGGMPRQARIIFNLLFILGAGSVLTGLVIQLINFPGNSVLSYATFAFGVVLLFSSAQFLTIQNAKVIKTKFPKAYINRNSWSSSKITEAILERLDHKLETEGFTHQEHLDILLVQIKHKAEIEKLPYVIFISALTAAFVPLWIAFVDKALELYKNDIITLFLCFLVLSLCIILATASLVHLRANFRDIALTKRKMLLELYALIEDVSLMRKLRK